MIQPPLLLSHLQHQQRKLEYSQRQMTNEPSKIFLKYLQEMDMFLIAAHDVDILTDINELQFLLFFILG